MEKEINSLKAKNYDLLMEIETLKAMLKREQKTKEELFDFWRANRYYNSDSFRNTSIDELKQMTGIDFLGSICIQDKTSFSGDEDVFHGLIKVRENKVWVGIQRNKRIVECQFEDVAWWKRATFDTVVFE